jgi:membrane protease YdiL (CAAX protease family)
MLGRGAGLLLTALVFAAYHLRFELWGLLGKTAFGLVFGILQERTGRLVSPAVRALDHLDCLGFH